MQATKEEKSGKAPPAGHNRRQNTERQRDRRSVEPIEGARTGSQGLGYLKDTDKKGNTGRPKRGR
ncbi:MAG: hypothetical protein L0I29_10765 [Hyphomicrobiales bacterium]|nr:hypothetical protein [Hyphomicrobiales bacterium]